MKQKKTEQHEQLSLFDIQLPPNDTETVEKIIETAPEITPEEPQVFKNPSWAKVTDKQYDFAYKTKPTVDETLKLLDKGVYKIGMHELLSDIFECGAIAISNKFDIRNAEQREARYLQIINKHDKDTQLLIAEVFAKIYVLLSNQIHPDVGFADYLGEIYMRSSTSSSRAGQFFTPWSVSKACAGMVIDENIIAEFMKEDKVLTLNEPTCGSGGMVLAAADVLYNKYDLNISRNLFVECGDIDIRCVHMTYLQLGLAGIPAIVYHRDGLTMETWDRWETPAYIMQWHRFKK